MVRIDDMIESDRTFFIVPREHTTLYFVPCLGITNECFRTNKNQNLMGYVFFWEYDFEPEKVTDKNGEEFVIEKMPKSEAIDCAKEYAEDFSYQNEMTSAVFETAHGLHIVGFTVLGNAKTYENRIRQELPNPFWELHDQRILRTSKKGHEPEPKFVEAYFTHGKVNSLGHVLAYMPLMPSKVTAKLLKEAKPFYPRYVFYLGKCKQPELLKWVDTVGSVP